MEAPRSIPRKVGSDVVTRAMPCPDSGVCGAAMKPVRIRSSIGIRHEIGARPIKRDSSEPDPREHRIGDLRIGEASERGRQSEGEKAGMAQGHRPNTVNMRAGT